MNIKMRYLALIAAGMLIAANTAIADKSIMIGTGNSDCEKLIELRAESESKEEANIYAAIKFSWAQGFLSALNMEHYGTDDMVDLSDHAGLQDWLDKFCEENPKSKYFFASVRLWNELRKQQGLKPDSPLPLK